MKISDQVQVTYVGGPLHGHREMRPREEVLQRMAILDGREQIHYDRRSWGGEGVGTGEIVYSEATYALRGLTDAEYYVLAESIEKGDAP